MEENRFGEAVINTNELNRETERVKLMNMQKKTGLVKHTYKLKVVD